MAAVLVSSDKMKRSARDACARFGLESLRGQSRRRRDRPMTKIAYVGLDVHAATITIAPLGERQRSRRSGRARTTRLRSGRRSSRLPRAVRSDAAYEAGLRLRVAASAQRHGGRVPGRCAIADPTEAWRPGQDGPEGRDAAKLARLLRSGDLTPITVPTEDQEAVRDLVRAREAARRNRTDARHRLTKFLLRHGQRYHASNWTKPFWAWVNHVAFEQAELTKTLQHNIDMALPRPANRRLGRSHRDHRRPRAFPRRGCSLELLAWHQHARRQGDRLRGLRLAPIRKGEPVHGLPRGCPQRAFERPETATRAAPSPSPATGVCDASSSRPRGHTVTT